MLAGALRGAAGTRHGYRVRPRPRLLGLKEPSRLTWHPGTSRLLWVKEPSGAPAVLRDGWHDVHRRLVELGRQRAAHEGELCHWLLEAERLAVYVQAGYASLREYAERILGLSGRQTEERLRVGRALANLPELERALRMGELCWSVVRELTRVASAQTEQAWIQWAQGRRAKEVERAVAERQPGDGPDAAGDPTRLRHRLCFEVRAETMALFRDLQARVGKELGALGQPVDDDTLLFELARRALGGPRCEPDDAGRASYQVAVSRCDVCGRTSIDAGRHTHVVDADVERLIACDAQHVGNVDQRPHMGDTSEGSTPRSDEHVYTPETTARAGERRRVRAAPGPAPHNGQRPHVGATPEPAPRAPTPRATQTIPPAIRRRIVRRHHGRCAVPGCQHHRFVDVHHTLPRAEGGTHDPERLILLCGAHHRAIHRGQLVLTGTASTGFAFHHADGSPYGAPLDPARIDVAQRVFAALTQLGFKPSQARDRIDSVQRRGAPPALREFLLAALHAGERPE